MGIHGPAGRLIELGERERGAQAEATTALLLRDRDCGPEGFLCRRGIGRIALEQDSAFAAKEEGVCPTFSCLLGEGASPTSIAGGQSASSKRPGHGFKLSERCHGTEARRSYSLVRNRAPGTAKSSETPPSASKTQPRAQLAKISP